MATKTAQEPSTLEEFISAFNTESVRVSSFMLKDVASSDGTRQIIIAGNSIVTKYLPELLEDAETITLTNEEFYKYKYNPKRLSYDVYGTTELWSMILDLNELYSATQFNLRTLKLFKASAFTKFERLISLDEYIVKQNEDEVQKILDGKE